MAKLRQKNPPKENYATVTTQTLKLDELEPAPYNARSITQEALSGLTTSIESFGLLAFPVVNQRGNKYRIVGGHQRVAVLKARGETEVECVVVVLDEATERRANFTLNNRAIQGRFVPELTKALLQEIRELVGEEDSKRLFGELRFDALVKQLTRSMSLVVGVDDTEKSGKVDEDDEPSIVRSKPFSQAGRFYRLGQHVLYCGKVESKGSLMGFGFEKADAAFMVIGRKDEASDAYVESYVAHLLANTDGPIYIATNFPTLPAVQERFTAIGGHWSNTLVWYSPDAKPSEEEFYKDVTIPVLYGWREDAAHYFCGSRDQGNVFKLRRTARSELPVEVIVRCLHNSTKVGGAVLDVDVRRGATVIAAEKTGRRLLGYANAPREADNVRARWAHFVHGTKSNWQAATPEFKG